jgi:hypothetical protein
MKKTIEKPKKGKKVVNKTTATTERMPSVSVKAKMAPVKASFKPKTTTDSTAYFRNKADVYAAAGERHAKAMDKYASTKGYNMEGFVNEERNKAIKNLKASAGYARSLERQKMKGAVGKDASGYATKIKPIKPKKK